MALETPFSTVIKFNVIVLSLNNLIVLRIRPKGTRYVLRIRPEGTRCVLRIAQLLILTEWLQNGTQITQI